MRLTPGDPAPWFVARTASRPDFHFDVVAGRHVILCFFGSAADHRVADILERFRQRTDLFRDQPATFFGVSCDPADEQLGRAVERRPGFRIFWDFDFEISTRYGVCREEGGSREYRPTTFVLDRNLRVIAVFPMHAGEDHVAQVTDLVARLPALPRGRVASPWAPVLLCPRVLEPELCRELIAFYERCGGHDSGFMRTDPATGLTIGVKDHAHKRRRDAQIEDRELRRRLRQRLHRRLVPEIRKAFQFQATYVERYIVACYDAAEGGHFGPHRDNTSKGTAHRAFAVTINLNAEDYEGGDLRFPEYGGQVYRAPTGGAIVFSCSLLHEVSPMRRGRRYCFLPFLYDEAGARIRRENLEYLGPNAAVQEPPLPAKTD